jgi:hypothetical protein
MLFKPDLIEKIIKHEKTQTRRLQRLSDRAMYLPNELAPRCVVHETNKHLRFEIGKTYAVQPGRGMPTAQVAWMRTAESIVPYLVTEDSSLLFQGLAVPLRIRLTAIRREDVRNISPEDVLAEGFEQPYLFWLRWAGMYDPCFLDTLIPISLRTPDHMAAVNSAVREALDPRPADRYQAWALTFEIA